MPLSKNWAAEAVARAFANRIRLPKARRRRFYRDISVETLESRQMLSGNPISVAAYMYSTLGSTGIPTLAAQLGSRSAVSEVYLKAFDIDGTGAVFPKTDSQTTPGNFYPHYWTGSPTPTPIPTFTALINSDLSNPYSSDPTTTVQASLTANAWTTQFGGGITIDSEFNSGAKPAVSTFPANMQSFFTNMRVFANTASQSFSFYFNPKYLDATRYSQQIVTANTASLKAILGTNPRNTVLFPVYADTNSQATQTTLQAGAYAAFSQGVGYKWIMDITQTRSVFADGIASLNTIGQTPSGANLKGAVAYEYIDNVTVTSSMKDNLATLSNLGLPALPGAPTIASVTSGPGQLGVSWLAPNNSGSPPVSEYLVKYSSNNGSSWTRFQPSTGPITALSCTVTGLTNGTPYMIKVIAKSALGIGPPSANSAPSTPATVPGAPTILSAVPSAGQIAVAWTVPASTGGSNITDYFVKISTNGTTWSRVTRPVSAALSHIITGLAGGTSYFIKVIAKNAFGISPPSVNAVSVAAATVPGKPTAVVAVSGNTQLAVTWAAPVNNGGSPITDYLVKYSSNSGATWKNFIHPPLTASPLTVTGLTNGTSYVIKVIAKNAIGISLPSANSAPATPAIPLAAPVLRPQLQVSHFGQDIPWVAQTNGVSSIKMDDKYGTPGSGYTAATAPTVTLDAPTGVGGVTATATASITNGTITSITVPGLGASVTAAAGNNGTITYTAVNSFTKGQIVSVTGLNTLTGTSLNIPNMVIATASSTQFTVTNSTIGTSSGGGNAVGEDTTGGAWSYGNPPTVTVSPAPSASGRVAIISVHQNTDGTIQYFAIKNDGDGGEGYADGSTLSFVLTPAKGDTTHSGPVTPTGLTITTATGTVGGITVKNAGSGYGAAQTVNVNFGSVPGATPPTGVTATVSAIMAPSQALFKAWATDYITFLVNTKIGTAFINIGDYSQIADKFSYLDPRLGTNGVPWIVTDFLDPLSKVVDANGSPVDIEVGALPYLDASNPFHLYGPGDGPEDPNNKNFAGNTFITDGGTNSPPKNNMYQAMQLINDINKMSTTKFITHLEFDGEGGGMFRDDTVYGFIGNQVPQVPKSDWVWNKATPLAKTNTWPTTGAGYTKWLWNHFMPGVASSDLANGGDMPGSGRTGPIASIPDVVYTDQEAVTRSTWNPTATPSTPPAPYQFGAMAYGAPAWPTNKTNGSLSWGPQQAYSEFYWFGELTYKPGPGSSLLTETTPKTLDSQTPALPWISTTDTTVYSAAPAIVFNTPPKGRPAAGYAVLKSDNTIDYIAITRLGDGYTTASPPTYSINNGTVRYPVVITGSSTNGIDPKYGKEFAPIFTKDTGGFISSDADVTFQTTQYTQAGDVLMLANATSSATHALGTLPPGYELIQKGMAVTGTGVAAGTTVVSVQVTQSPLTVSITLSSTPVNPGALTFASTGINLVNIVDHGAGYSMGALVTNAGTGYTTAPTVTFTPPSPSVPNAVRATGVAVLSNGGVGSIQITNPGFGYTSEPTITFSGGGGTNATAEAHILNYPRVTIAATSPNAGSGAVAYAVVTPTANNGPYDPDTGYSVSSIAFTNPGSGYFTAADSTSGNYATLPTIVFSTPTSTNPSVTCRTATAEGGLVPVVALNAFWLDGANAIGSPNELGTLDPTTNPSVLESVGQVTIAAGGSGYDARATVTFTPSASGDTATGYVVVNASGGVERIAITNPGSGYSAASPPVVTIAGNGAGSGASVSVVATDLVPRIRGGGNSINWNLWDGTGQPGSNLNLFSQNAAQTTYSYYSSYPQSLAQMFGDPLYAGFGPPKLNDVFYQPLNVGQDSSSSVAGGQGAIASFSLEGILRSNTGPAAAALGGNADSMDAHYQFLSTQPGTTSPLVAFNSLGGTFSGLSSLTYVDFVTFLNSAADIVVGSQKTALNGIQFASSTDYSAVAGTVTFTGSPVAQSTLAIGKGMTVEGPGIPVGTTVTGVTETLTGTTITSLVITLSNSSALPTGSLCFYKAFTAEDVTFAIYDIAFIPYSWISSNSKVANSWTITA